MRTRRRIHVEDSSEKGFSGIYVITCFCIFPYYDSTRIIFVSRANHTLDLNDLCSLIRNENFSLQGTSLARIRCSVDLSKLFQSPPIRFHAEEILNRALYQIPDNEDKVCIPTNSPKADRPSKLVEERGSIDADRRKRHTFGTLLVGQYFDWIECLQGSIAKRIDDAKNEDEDDAGIRGRGILRLVFVDSRSDGNASEDDRAAYRDRYQGLAATESTNEGGPRVCTESLGKLIAEIDIKHLDRICNACG